MTRHGPYLDNLTKEGWGNRQTFLSIDIPKVSGIRLSQLNVMYVTKWATKRSNVDRQRRIITSHRKESIR